MTPESADIMNNPMLYIVETIQVEHPNKYRQETLFAVRLLSWKLPALRVSNKILRRVVGKISMIHTVQNLGEQNAWYTAENH